MSDRIRTSPDVPFKPAGIGCAPTFRRACCHKPKLIAGRKLQRVCGLRTYVCKECAR